MKIDAWIGLPEAASSQELAGIGDRARMMEQDGYSGLLSAETSHDPFLPLALAAEHTERIELMTAIAVGFARNPMVLAQVAWDLQALSQGRFLLGLGSQIQAHITKRFSMPWSRPAARMEEMIAAIRAIWEAWQTGERLNFRGDFYRHTLMTPMFSPGPIDVAPPPILISAVGPLMTRVAGPGCGRAGVPRLPDGRVPAGRDDAQRECRAGRGGAGPLRLPDLDAGVRGVRIPRGGGRRPNGPDPPADRLLRVHSRLPGACWSITAGATPRPSSTGLSKRGQWVEMGNVIDDDMLGAFAVVAEPHDVPGRIAERFGGTLDRLQFYAGVRGQADRWGPIIEEIKAA